MRQKSLLIIALAVMLLSITGGCITIKFEAKANQENIIKIGFETPAIPKESSDQSTSVVPNISLTKEITLYDDFNNTAYEGSFNPVLWQDSYNVNSHFQKDGILIISQTGKPKQGTALTARQYSDFVLDYPIAFEAKLMLDPKKHPNSSQETGSLALSLIARSPSNETWIANCELTGDNSERAGIWCHDWWNNGERSTKVMEEGRVNYGTWHTFRIEIDPTSMTVTYFINGELVGSFTPKNADKLKNARFSLTANVWTNSADTITGYVDDVSIGSIQVPTSTPITTSVTPLPESESGKLVYEENFESGFASGFTFQSGDWKVVDDNTGNKVLEMTSTTCCAGALYGPANISDGIIELRFRLISADYHAEHHVATVGFRLNTTSGFTGYGLVYEPGGSNLRLVYQENGGVWQPPERSSGGGSIQARAGSWVTLRVEFQGENIKVFINGQPFMTAQDSRDKVGGLILGSNGTVTVQFDDIKVWELSKPLASSSEVTSGQNPLTPTTTATVIPSSSFQTILDSAQVTYKDSFDNPLFPGWLRWGGNSSTLYIKNGSAFFVGDAQLHRNHGLEESEACLVSLTFSQDGGFMLAGTPESYGSNWRAWGVMNNPDMGPDGHMQDYFQEGIGEQAANIYEPFSLQGKPDTEYDVLLWVQSPASFMVRVWEKDNPAVFGEKQFQMIDPDNWVGRKWHCNMYVSSGIIQVSGYSELRLSPTTVPMTPTLSQ